jgi:hypothetical protein
MVEDRQAQDKTEARYDRQDRQAPDKAEGQERKAQDAADKGREMNPGRD